MSLLICLLLNMGTTKIAVGISAALLLLVVLIYSVSDSESAAQFIPSSEVSIEDTWELPAELAEISGMAFLGEEKIVGVQDEKGVLYVYNLSTQVLEKQIQFGPNGDYEGVALNEDTAYVLRTDGTIFVVQDYLTTAEVSEIKTMLTVKEDPEGLCYDQKNNRLLIAIKGDDPREEGSKAIYAIDLSQQDSEAVSVFQVDLSDAVFKEVKEDDLQDTFKPSEINVHPETGQIYLLEGQNPKLLILDEKGSPQELMILDEKDFPQAEGLTFDPNGNIYISNEGSPATIHRISIK